jgi:hypothetical protein
MKRLAFTALMTIVICVVMMLAVGIALGRMSPSNAASGVHGYAHINCTVPHRFVC